MKLLAAFGAIFIGVSAFAEPFPVGTFICGHVNVEVEAIAMGSKVLPYVTLTETNGSFLEESVSAIYKRPNGIRNVRTITGLDLDIYGNNYGACIRK